MKSNENEQKIRVFGGYNSSFSNVLHLILYTSVVQVVARRPHPAQTTCNQTR
jgi:hypothetical protein